MASYTPTQFYIGQPATGAGTNLYTATGSCILKQIVLSNVTTSGGTVTLYLRPLGAAAAVGNALLTAVNIPSNSIMTLDVTWVLNNTDIITAINGTAATVTIAIFGVVV